MPTIPDYDRLGRELRREVLAMCERTGTGHVGPAFSVVEILLVLYEEVLRGAPGDAERDRLLLSKGHACASLYAVLHRRGVIGDADFESFASNGSRLGHHPHLEPAIGLEANLGSLGHGLSMAAGMAFAARKQGSPARFFAVLSDGETNEGSVWEAAAFAAHHGLVNLSVTVDANKFQALGATRDIIEPSPHVERWRGFGWDAVEVDGHDPAALAAAYERVGSGDRPHAVIAHTVKGKGVSFMERQLLWHYRVPRGDEYRAALAELA